MPIRELEKHEEYVGVRDSKRSYGKFRSHVSPLLYNGVNSYIQGRFKKFEFCQ